MRVHAGRARAHAAGPLTRGSSPIADLEEKIPWTAVKKSWIQRRGDWVKSVSATLNCMALSKLLLMLEGALKSEALAPTWTLHRGAWRGRVEVAHLPRELDAIYV